MEDRTYLHAKLPRVNCPEHGVRTIAVPWANTKSKFTHHFEAFILAMAKDMPVNAVAKIAREHDTMLWRIIRRNVYNARKTLDMRHVSSIGLDETAARRGHDYVTVFMDMKTRSVLYATDGLDQNTVAEFARDLQEHGGDPAAVTAAAMDMSPAFIAGVEAHLVNDQISFDRFHVAKAVGEAVDQVRREEQKVDSDLKRTRYLWLKNRANLSENQRDRPEVLLQKPLKTARAYAMRESLQGLWEQPQELTEPYLRRWYFWATHSRLKPLIDVARTIHRHWDGILRAVTSRLTTGPLEGLNSLIQAAKAKARGYRSKSNLNAMIYLLGGGLDLPALHTI